MRYNPCSLEAHHIDSQFSHLLNGNGTNERSLSFVNHLLSARFVAGCFVDFCVMELSGHYHPLPFTDEETDSVSLNELSKITQLVSGTARIPIHVSLTPEPVCSTHFTASRKLGSSTCSIPGYEM